MTTPGELSGWEDRRRLADAPQPTGGVQPTALDAQLTCQFLEALGYAEDARRIDPTFVIPDMDGRIQAR